MDGGVIYDLGRNTLILSETIFSHNSANGYGGG